MSPVQRPPDSLSRVELRERLDALAVPLKPLVGKKRFRHDKPLAPYTTFQIGGPADVFVEVHSIDELVESVGLAREYEVPFFLLGTGANILIGDLGIRGLVIRNRAEHASIDDNTGVVTAESGAVVWPGLIEATINAGLGGLHHYAGIPSSVGGAMWQNLHFLSPDRSRTMFVEEVTRGAEILTENGEQKSVDRDYFEFGYDDSILHHRPDIVLSATFQLEREDPKRLREVVASNLEWREKRHPPLDTEPSAGSIFKKIDGVGAGRLIDWSGMKGTRIGGAEVTHRHANILINRGGATARDVRELITLIQRTVEEKQGYRLHPEIGMIGDFGPLPDVLPDDWHNQDGFQDGVPPGGHPEAHRDAERR